MLYVWIGFLKSNADPIPQSAQALGTDFVGQPLIKSNWPNRFVTHLANVRG